MCNYCIYIISWSIFQVHVPFHQSCVSLWYTTRHLQPSKLHVLQVLVHHIVDMPPLIQTRNVDDLHNLNLDIANLPLGSKLLSPWPKSPTSSPKQRFHAGISGARNNGEWGNIPIPTLHEIWCSSCFWVDCCFNKKIIGRNGWNRGKRPTTKLFFSQCSSEVFPFETWGNSIPHRSGLGAKEEKTGRKWTEFNLNLKACEFLDAAKNAPHGKGGNPRRPFCGDHLSSPDREKKKHGSRHSFYSNLIVSGVYWAIYAILSSPKARWLVWGDLSLQLSPTYLVSTEKKYL